MESTGPLALLPTAIAVIAELLASGTMRAGCNTTCGLAANLQAGYSVTAAGLMVYVSASGTPRRTIATWKTAVALMVL